jgi:hypothetical protein
VRDRQVSTVPAGPPDIAKRATRKLEYIDLTTCFDDLTAQAIKTEVQRIKPSGVA